MVMKKRKKFVPSIGFGFLSVGMSISFHLISPHIILYLMEFSRIGSERTDVFFLS